MANTLSQSLLVAVPLAPLAGAIVAGFFGKAVGRRGAHMVTILGVLVAFILSGEMAFAYFIGHAPRGFYPALNEGTLAVLFCFVFLYLVFAGAGPLSIDSARTSKAPPQD